MCNRLLIVNCCYDCTFARRETRGIRCYHPETAGSLIATTMKTIREKVADFCPLPVVG